MSGETLLGALGLLIFFAFFVGVILWVFRPGSKEIYRKAADIPLKESD